ncbi:MAG: sugar ABC transporter permease [Paenibacillaceae bacterium ZCTH02-B3]|nr:MAG: sugar ABC transporter permease [Paenibacillaceae bacterium ZCTH02-B3]
MRTALTSPVAYALFVLPTILLYGLFFLYPMLSSSFYAFTDWNGLDDYRFVGFDNFLRALQDERFHKAILNNLAFIGFSVFVQIPVIVLMAMLISSVKRLQRFYKTAVFVPSILSTSVIGILWGFLYEPEMGPVNRLLGVFGIEPIYWLADPRWALLSVLIANAWQWMGFYIVLVLAAILAIPKELHEAAVVDGANGWQRALSITVPLIMPLISVVVMLSIAGGMRVVDIVLVMTKGGPVGATEVMASYMVNEAMGIDPNYGFGTAIALIIFAFALLLTSLYQMTFGRRMEGGWF